MTTTNTALKLGDTVTAIYGDDLVTGVIVGYDHRGGVQLAFSSPQRVGRRTEDRGVFVSPDMRHGMRLVTSGPGLSDNDVIFVSGHGTFLRAEVSR
jgi:hypothetical protein